MKKEDVFKKLTEKPVKKRVQKRILKYPDLTKYQANLVRYGIQKGEEWLKINHPSHYKVIKNYLSLRKQ